MRNHRSMLNTAARLLDRGLDLAVLPGYSRIGIELRRRLWDEPAGAGLAGKRALITGASSGLGEAATELFAAGGADVHMLVRDEAKGRRVAESTAAKTGVEPTVEVCDLSDLDAVRNFATGFAERTPELQVLVNNAGVMPPERTLTDEGFELTFATNVLGPFLLTNLLLPVLRGGAPARVINVSSGGMYTEGLDANDLQLADRDYDAPAFYAHSKRCEVILTELWAEREPDDAVSFHSMHPGWADTPGVESSLPNFHRFVGPLLRSPAEGADTIAWLAGTDDPALGSGRFWHDRAPRPTHRLPRTREDEADRPRLWDQCAELTGPGPRGG